MADPDPPPEDALSSLRRRIDVERTKGAPPEPKPVDGAASLALRFGGEFGAAILVGAGLGFGADHFLHTQPWGLGIGLVLGFAAGIMNAVRAASAYSAAHPPDPNVPSVPDAEEDDD
jgi:ATP synthase protein I